MPCLKDDAHATACNRFEQVVLTKRAVERHASRWTETRYRVRQPVPTYRFGVASGRLPTGKHLGFVWLCRHRRIRGAPRRHAFQVVKKQPQLHRVLRMNREPIRTGWGLAVIPCKKVIGDDCVHGVGSLAYSSRSGVMRGILHEEFAQICHAAPKQGGNGRGRSVHQVSHFDKRQALKMYQRDRFTLQLRQLGEWRWRAAGHSLCLAEQCSDLVRRKSAHRRQFQGRIVESVFQIRLRGEHLGGLRADDPAAYQQACAPGFAVAMHPSPRRCRRERPRVPGVL